MVRPSRSTSTGSGLQPLSPPTLPEVSSRVRKRCDRKGSSMPAHPSHCVGSTSPTVRAIRAAEAHAPPGSTFCVSDNRPVTRREFYTYAAGILNAPPATFEPAAPTAGPMPHEGNRRIRSAKLLGLPGMILECPDYRIGLKEAVRQE